MALGQARGRAARRRRLRRRIERLPRIHLGNFPTPLEPLPRLSARLGGPKLFVKRDDLTGLAFGGNKTRTLEYVLGEILLDRPEVLVTGAGAQSNWSRQSAAAAARLGIPIVLVLRGSDSAAQIQGNLLLDLWLGADVRFVPEPDVTLVVAEQIDLVVAELRASGRKAVKIDPWAPAAAVGYVQMAIELQQQCDALGVEPTRIWSAAAGPTQSGLILGAKELGWSVDVTGIAPIRWSGASMEARTADAANRAAAVLGVGSRVDESDVKSLDQYIGPGYAVPSGPGLAAMRLVARTEGLLLDPVYTGKAMAALIDHVEQGRLTRDDTVVFVHTGGLPATFAYGDAIVEMANGPEELVT